MTQQRQIQLEAAEILATAHEADEVLETILSGLVSPCLWPAGAFLPELRHARDAIHEVIKRADWIKNRFVQWSPARPRQ